MFLKPDFSTGMLTKEFVKCASSRNIINQMYWGSLVGNHCHALFTDETTAV